MDASLMNEKVDDFVSSPNVLRTDKDLTVKGFYSFTDKEFTNGRGQRIGRVAVTGASGTHYALVRDFLMAITSVAVAPSITLPRPSLAGSGKVYVVKDESGGAGSTTVTVSSAGEETIDGASTSTLTSNYQSRSYYSNGSAWFTF